MQATLLSPEAPGHSQRWTRSFETKTSKRLDWRKEGEGGGRGEKELAEETSYHIRNGAPEAEIPSRGRPLPIPWQQRCGAVGEGILLDLLQARYMGRGLPSSDVT